MVIDEFAGPGGWDVAAAELGISGVVGIEVDAVACATRAAAGLATVRADVARFPVEQLPGQVWGQIGSPPCTTFSAAGDQAGNAVHGHLAALIGDMFAGWDTRAEHRRAMADTLTASGWPGGEMPEPKRAEKIRAAVTSAALIAEPARLTRACRPAWIALEQVPAVLPLWQVYAAHLAALGYATWAGRVQAADYGVPQLRERAVLIASQTRPVAQPERFYYDPRRGHQLWGTPWVSMADALGWGATDRPAPTVTAGGTSTGGAEPFGHRDRDALAAERDAGRWKPREDGSTSVRITVAEAACLQTFPARYPWQGGKGKQSQQVGNAVPPQMAMHVLAEAAGVERGAVAA